MAFWQAKKTRLTLFFLAAFLPPVVATSGDDGVLRYYLNKAREEFHNCDVRKQNKGYVATLVIRRYRIDAQQDTTGLDTAVVTVYYTTQQGQIFKDTMTVSRSTFLEDIPEPANIWLAAPWGEPLRFALYPNDRGRGALAISYEADQAGPDHKSGIALIDRETCRLISLTEHNVSDTGDNAGRARSAEADFIVMDSVLVAMRVYEIRERPSLFGRRFETVETRLLRLRPK